MARSTRQGGDASTAPASVKSVAAPPMRAGASYHSCVKAWNHGGGASAAVCSSSAVLDSTSPTFGAVAAAGAYVQALSGF
jgi:hypothetical protein